MNYKTIIIPAAVFAFALSLSPRANAQLFSLGSAQSFAVLGGSTVTNTGSTVLTGDLGVSPGTSITGFGPGTYTGTEHSGDSTAQTAHNDLVTSYNILAGMTGATDLSGQNLGGMSLTPGVYSFSSAAQLTGALHLNDLGNANALYVFQIGSSLTTASGSTVTLSSGQNAGNIFWQVGSSATVGTGTDFEGNILAADSITLTTGADIDYGRALAETGAVTLDTNNVSTSGLGLVSGAAGTIAPAAVPEPGEIVTGLSMLGVTGLALLRGRRGRRILA